MLFYKMHALGNDGVFINKKDLSAEAFSAVCSNDKKLRIKLCNRHYGIGGDILVIYEYKKIENKDEVEALFFNPDGSQAEICINAARCLGLLLKTNFNLQKFSLKALEKIYEIRTENASNIYVNIGWPSFDLYKHVSKNLTQNIQYLLNKFWPEPQSKSKLITQFVNIGNPHLIILMPDGKFHDEKFKSFKEQAGKSLSQPSADLFPRGVNVSFTAVQNENNVLLEVYERGAGFTSDCGSAACAAAAARFKHALIKSCVTIEQPGGNLDIAIEKNKSIIQRGSAAYVFEGVVDI